MGNHLYRFVSNDLTLRASCVDATEAVQQMQWLQGSKALPTIAVGRAMVGALLLASHMKDKQSVGILVRGDGPLSRVYAEATSHGSVRGYSPNRYFEPESYENGLKLQPVIGRGLLTVTRNLPRQKQPHQGTVELVNGEIGDDLAHYLLQSDQIRSYISVGVTLDQQAQVASAGGVLIEIMPGVEEQVAIQLEKNVESARTTNSVTLSLEKGEDIKEILKPFLAGFPYTEIPYDGDVRFDCPCSKERVLRAFHVLDVTDLNEMIEEKTPQKAECQMCGKPYEVSTEELEEIRTHRIKTTMH